MKRKNPEQQFQIQVASFLRATLHDSVLWTAIGHGGGGKVRGALLKAMGLRKGIPDLVLFYANTVLWLELKAPKGRVSPEQDAFRVWSGTMGHYLKVCRTIDDVHEALAMAKIPMRGRISA